MTRTLAETGIMSILRGTVPRRDSVDQKPFVTTREAARLLNVSLRTVQLWAENGILNAWKTAGGHRRISVESVNRIRGEQLRVTDGYGNTPGPSTILLVEDDPVFREFCKLKIASWQLGASVITARDGFEGLLLIGRLNPQIVITDLRMPGLDGFQMIRSLQSTLKRMHIIVITGLNDHQIEQSGGLPQNVPVLRKPDPFGQLEELLRMKLELLPRARGAL